MASSFYICENSPHVLSSMVPVGPFRLYTVEVPLSMQPSDEQQGQDGGGEPEANRQKAHRARLRHGALYHDECGAPHGRHGQEGGLGAAKSGHPLACAHSERS